MSSLLEMVLEAHGGLKVWNSYSDLITNVEFGGLLCERKQLKQLLPLSRLLLSLRVQRIVMMLPETQAQLLVQLGLVSSVGDRGLELERLVDPRGTLMREGPDSPWDTLRGAYFVAWAVWHNVTAPFLYTFPGFETEEVEPWSEGGQIWRVLKITFPPTIEVHSRVQYAYYGDDGLLRRQRYTVDILGRLECINYVTGYETQNGILLPVSRDVFACDSNGRKAGASPLAELRLLAPFFSD